MTPAISIALKKGWRTNRKRSCVIVKYAYPMCHISSQIEPVLEKNRSAHEKGTTPVKGRNLFSLRSGTHRKQLRCVAHP